jgi:murein DD-endopeptidase MepM/ murein hydrolase activator NlpD
VTEVLAVGAAGGLLLLLVFAVLQLPRVVPVGSRRDLGGGRLLFPVPAVSPSAMSDSFADRRGFRTHQAVDILAPRGSAVVAVDDGTLARLSSSAAGGISIYQFDTAERYCFFYAHLERYAPGLTEGQAVKRGLLLGYVGTTGNAAADAPHLHFAISELTAPKQWWGGTPIDPYPLWK